MAGRETVRLEQQNAPYQVRGERFAEFAVLDTDAWQVEFWRLPYDCAAAEAKAVAFGYRIPPLLEKLYSARRQVFGRFNRR